MLERIIRAAIAHRWLMMALTLALVAIGSWSFTRLSIDATPDITNVQVQINTGADNQSRARRTYGQGKRVYDRVQARSRHSRGRNRTDSRPQPYS